MEHSGSGGVANFGNDNGIHETQSSGSVVMSSQTFSEQTVHGAIPVEKDHTKRVLIADDSVVSRHLLASTLEAWGHEVVAASDGAEAWAILQDNNPPQLVILDWMMPRMTGPDVCRLLREKGRDPYTYVLLLSSRNQKEDLITGMNAGADDYLIKPFDQHELLVRLRAGMRVLRLQAELLATQEALREQATHDSLTKLYNRPFVLDVLQRELSRVDREIGPVGVVMIDLDHFKQINDTYGHHAGDAVLREAARRMRMSIRSYDSLGRYGGEEFLMVLPGCTLEDCIQQAERIRWAIAAEPVAFEDIWIPLTASLGVTTALPERSSLADNFVRVADEALYLAKRHGRNKVVSLGYDSPAAANLTVHSRHSLFVEEST